ncbi:MAG: hypothetical protein ACFHXK_00820 [bacterium]
MPTGQSSEYVLFDPKKRVANKAVAIKLAIHHFSGSPIDKATINTSDWGKCHVAAYTDLVGAMIATTETDVQFGDAEWHYKGRIIMVREQPSKRQSPARITFYVCEIEDLFREKSIGRSGVKWTDVAKMKLYGKTLYSSDLVSALSDE